jgi:hypothetical protein
MMVMGLSSHAQDSNNPWLYPLELMPLTLERVLVVVKLGRPSFSQPFAVKDNWNILPSVSYLSVSKYIGDNFSLTWVR